MPTRLIDVVKDMYRWSKTEVNTIYGNTGSYYEDDLVVMAYSEKNLPRRIYG